MQSPINFNSPEWIQVFNQAKSDITRSYIELTGFNVSHERSLFLRGQIESLRNLIAQDAKRFSEFSINPFPN